MTRLSPFGSVLHISASTSPILIRPSSIALYWFYLSPSDGLARLRACSSNTNPLWNVRKAKSHFRFVRQKFQSLRHWRIQNWEIRIQGYQLFPWRRGWDFGNSVAFGNFDLCPFVIWGPTQFCLHRLSPSPPPDLLNFFVFQIEHFPRGFLICFLFQNTFLAEIDWRNARWQNWFNLKKASSAFCLFVVQVMNEFRSLRR